MQYPEKYQRFIEDVSDRYVHVWRCIEDIVRNSCDFNTMCRHILLDGMYTISYVNSLDTLNVMYDEVFEFHKNGRVEYVDEDIVIGMFDYIKQ